ncbi:MAG TPA: alpha/beta fold hydrolase, partial [Polyangiaceae bacterium]|nr:alpha/beta fold hydrolase [Polyangiaceae bacterium]
MICKPFGDEMLCSHRPLRYLAEGLAAAGFPTLRLDYDGTGDSSGDDTDPGRVPAWLDSIEAGVRELQSRGARRVALVGVRFGALLAAEYAKRNPVHALVLIAPPASGRAYVREMRAFQAMRAPTGATAKIEGRPEGDESVGFQLTPATAAALEKLSIVGDAPPAPNVLILARDDLDGHERRLVDKLGKLGASVTLARPGGYAAMVMQGDPVKAEVPELMWKHLTGWLSNLGGDARDGVFRTKNE